MTLKIELTAEQEARLSELAQEIGLPAEEYARRRLLAELLKPERPMTGAEAMAYWKQVGALGQLKDRPDSPEYARELRRQAETRDWESGCS